jgi:hypothetical protein
MHKEICVQMIGAMRDMNKYYELQSRKYSFPVGEIKESFMEKVAFELSIRI